MFSKAFNLYWSWYYWWQIAIYENINEHVASFNEFVHHFPNNYKVPNKWTTLIDKGP